jgi:hypothetical protein
MHLLLSDIQETTSFMKLTCGAMAAQSTVNRWVEGSNPSRSAEATYPRVTVLL